MSFFDLNDFVSPRVPPFPRLMNVCRLNVFVCVCACERMRQHDREGLHGIGEYNYIYIGCTHTHTNIFCISDMHVKIVIDDDFRVDSNFGKFTVDRNFGD